MIAIDCIVAAERKEHEDWNLLAAIANRAADAKQRAALSPAIGEAGAEMLAALEAA